MQDTSAEPPLGERLDSWKDIATYLRREVRTVQLWEKNEGLPVHRHSHRKRATVYAYRTELDAWWSGRRATLQEQGPAPERPRFRPFTVAGALGLFLLCGVWLGTARLPSPPAGKPKIVPLTSDRGSEMGASFSPDGSRVAFAWKPEGKLHFDIYLKEVKSGRTTQLTNTADSSEVDPAWSPDGREIAFFRSRPDRSCGVYTVAPLGGSERLLVEMSGKSCGCWEGNSKLSTAQLSWSPDGKWLARAGISLTSMETGEDRELTSSPRGGPDLYPAFSPDGRSLAFVRWVNSNAQELYTVPLTGGNPTRVRTQGQRIYGVAWTFDGKELVYSSGKWDWGESDLWQVSPSGGSPAQVVAGGERAWLPAIPRRGGRLGFTRKLSETNIWEVRVRNAGRKPDGAVRLIASTQADGAPALSPDARRIAFVSDRSGTWQIWVCDRDGSNATRLTSLLDWGASLPAWSPDGSEIAFNSLVKGGGAIYIIPAGGGTPRRLTNDHPLDYAPAWSRDGRWVYFASDRTGRREIWKVPAEGGDSLQVTKQGGQRPVESADGKFVYYEKGPTFAREFEPWRAPVHGGDEEPALAEDLRSRWTLAEDGLYYYEQHQSEEVASAWSLNFLEFATGKKHVVAWLAGTPLIGHRPAVSPDRQAFLYAQLDLNETDLMLIEEFR